MHSQKNPLFAKIRGLTTSLVFCSLVALAAHAPQSWASEVDTFNHRFEPLEDSLERLDKKLNTLFLEALSAANEKAGCDESRLYRQLRKKFKNHVFDEFNKWLLDNIHLFDHIRTPVERTIYKDFNFFQSPIQGGFARIIRDPTGKILNVNGKRVGNDKFEHMMGSGYRYFKKHYLKGNPIEDSLNIGWKAETGMLGALMTGVMSYGDLVANFQGMRFWNHMLQQHDDVFGENIGPYIVCQNHQWKKAKSITLATYVDDAMDESINCSRFRTPKMVIDVKNRLKDYQARDQQNRSYSCPMFPEKLEAMTKKYSPWLEWMINTDGHASMKELTKRP